jgi:hypothetical protein
MQNPNIFKNQDQNGEEEKYGQDGIVSIIDHDYVLNFLNDIDSVQRR